MSLVAAAAVSVDLHVVASVLSSVVAPTCCWLVVSTERHGFVDARTVSAFGSCQRLVINEICFVTRFCFADAALAAVGICLSEVAVYFVVLCQPRLAVGAAPHGGGRVSVASEFGVASSSERRLVVMMACLTLLCRSSLLLSVLICS